MYKRPAQVLFVGSADRSSQLLCEVLMELLREQGSQLLQGRCVECGQTAVMEEGLAWADLIIALDAAAHQFMTDVAPGSPLRCWSIPQGDAAQRVYIRDKLDSMAAGMRMLQRLDG